MLSENSSYKNTSRSCRSIAFSIYLDKTCFNFLRIHYCAAVFISCFRAAYHAKEYHRDSIYAFLVCMRCSNKQVNNSMFSKSHRYKFSCSERWKLGTSKSEQSACTLFAIRRKIVGWRTARQIDLNPGSLITANPLILVFQPMTCDTVHFLTNRYWTQCKKCT